MARRLQIDDTVKPVAPTPPLPPDDLSEGLRRYNASLPEASVGVDVTIDPDAVRQLAARQIDAMLSAPGRAMMEAAFPDVAAEIVQRAEGERRRLMTERPQVARIDPIAADARAAQERATRQQAERILADRIAGATGIDRARVGRAVARANADRTDLDALFQPAAPKPTVDVRGALTYLAGKPAQMVELHHVAVDMSQRGSFVSARQFEYAKAICNKPRNRRLLRDEYDLTALDREEWGGASQPAAARGPARAFPPNVRVHFDCVITGTPPQAVMISFGYNFEGRQSVRSISVPSNRITIRGGLGERVRCAVDAEWLLTERRINPTLIPGFSLTGTTAVPAVPTGRGQPARQPTPIRRRARMRNDL